MAWVVGLFTSYFFFKKRWNLKGRLQIQPMDVRIKLLVAAYLWPATWGYVKLNEAKEQERASAGRSQFDSFMQGEASASQVKPVVPKNPFD